MIEVSLFVGTEGGLRFEILLLTPRYPGVSGAIAAGAISGVTAGRTATANFPTRADMNSALRPGPRSLCIECMRRLRNGRNGRGRQ